MPTVRENGLESKRMYPPRPNRTVPGRLEIPKKRLVVPGDTQSFYTPTFLFRNPTLRNFTLADTTSEVNLWVDTQEWTSSSVSEAAVDSLLGYLSIATPTGSVDEANGIVANNISVFGPHPDQDSSGQIDILWYDLPDEYQSNGQFIPGFVRPEDYDGDPSSNAADVVYLDTNPLLNEFGIMAVASTSAAVLQSLTQLVSDGDEGDFLAFGMSELAVSVNGFASIGSEYLWFPAEHAIPLFSFDGFPGDFQRSALFARYLFNRFGSSLVQSLVADTSNGAQSFLKQTQTANHSAEGIILDFHIANYANIIEQSPRYGYGPATDDIGAFPSTLIDGSLAQSFDDSAQLEPGAVRYYSFRNVSNFASTTGGTDPILTGTYVEFTSAAELADSSAADVSLADNFREVMVANVNSSLIGGDLASSISASWTDTAISTENAVYDDGMLWVSAGNFVNLEAGGRQANRFEIPSGFRLTAVSFAPFYLNMFTNNGQPIGSASDPRDFSVVVREDASGVPGDVISSTTFVDRRPFSFASAGETDLVFQLNRLEDVQRLDNLEGSVFISLENAGEDDNYLVMALTDNASSSAGFLYGDFTGPLVWSNLEDLTVNQIPLAGKAIPIRAQFQNAAELVNVETTELPQPQVSPYPNPAKTSITLDLGRAPSPGERIVIVNLLGREVMSSEPKRPLVFFQFESNPSGVYYIRSSTHGFIGSVVLTK